MGTVGSKTPFRLKRTLQSCEQSVYRYGDRFKFTGQLILCNRREVSRAARFNILLKIDDAAKGEPDDPPDTH